MLRVIELYSHIFHAYFTKSIKKLPHIKPVIYFNTTIKVLYPPKWLLNVGDHHARLITNFEGRKEGR